MAEFQSLRPEVRNWDLTSDEKFYSKLDTFLNNVLSQCEIIQKNAETTEYETNAVSIYLEDTFNALSNLSNKKFIESSMAPLEDPQMTPKDTKKANEITLEQKQENFRKAVQNAITVFNITNNEDDELLTKSHTMSMSMFKSTDHLPFLIGSKAFASDEYLGIIDKSEDPAKYLHKLNPEALEEPANDNMQISPSSGMNQGSSNVSSNGSAHTVVPPSSGKIELRDNSLLPPGPFHVLLEQYESKAGTSGSRPQQGHGGRPPMGNLLSEITGRNNPAAGGRPNLMNEIEGRGKLMTEIGGRGRLQEEPSANSKENIMNEITRNRLSTDIGRVADIRNNPMYQPIQQAQTKGNRLFDEDEEDVEVGNSDIFQSKSSNKKKFENLLSSNPVSNPATMTANAMFNPLGNPFDPFGLQNPFLPFNPKSELAQAPAQKSDIGGRNPMMGLPTETTFATKNIEEPENTSKVNKLNKLFEDSDEDDEARLNKQKLLSQKYRPESKIAPLQEEKTPTPQPKATATTTSSNTKVSKLFDDDEDSGFMSMRKNTAPPKREVPATMSTSKPAKKKLFGEEDEDAIKEEEESSFLSKKPQENKKKTVAFEDDDDDMASSVRRSKTMAGNKGAKPSLFDDDDDDGAPFGGNKKGKKEEAPKPKKKTLFDDDDDGETPEPDAGKEKKQKLPTQVNAAPVKEKKSLFNAEEESEIQAPVKIEEKPKVIEQIKPIVEEKPEVVQQEEKPVVEETPEKEVRSSVQPAIFNEIEVKPAKETTQTEATEGWAAPKTGNNLTQLIKASHLNKKKRFGDSSEEDSESDGESVPVRKSETKQEETKHDVIEEPVKKEPKVEEKLTVESTETEQKLETEPARPSISKPSNISSKISALQNQLNLNMDALRPGDGLPPHMRKPKPSIQPEESSTTLENSQSVIPGGISHTAALSKPKQQARAKKTIMFEDDEDEQEEAKSFGFATKEKLAQPEKAYIEPPKIQEPEVQRISYSQQPVYQEEVPAQRASTVQKKKVAFEEEEAPAKPIENPSYGSDNPLALLKGLKELNENKSSPKKNDRASVKRVENYEEEDESVKPDSNQRISMGADNPLALLSGLKEMDASKGRKSKAGGGRKTKGIFEDDEEDGNDGFLTSKKETKNIEAKPRESNRLTKLFDDSDEDKKGQGWGRKSESPVKSQNQSKGKPRLFEDDDE